jgi:hypothetical protein
MEGFIISAALFFVMVLLFLVVYDSNTTMQRLVGRLLSRSRREGPVSHQEVTMEEQESIGTEISQQIAGVDPETGGLVSQEEMVVPPDGPSQPAEKPQGVLKWYAWYLGKLFRRGSGRSQPQAAGALTATVSAVDMLRNEVADLASRLAQTEASVERIDQLDEGLNRVGEETEMVSEEMKDILGSIRVSIDGLEGRLNQMDTELQALKDQAGTTPQAGTPAGLDEETLNKIKRLEESVADMTDSIGSLPDEVRKAAANAQVAMNSSEEIGNRLEVIADNLQSTLGYGVRKTFRCDSCGTQGFVASQVSCSKCGTASWWGWWPETDLAEGMDDDGVDSDLADSLESAAMDDRSDAPDMIETVAEISDMPEMIELAESIEQADMGDASSEAGDVPEMAEIAQMLEALDALETYDAAESETPEA